MYLINQRNQELQAGRTAQRLAKGDKAYAASLAPTSISYSFLNSSGAFSMLSCCAIRSGPYSFFLDCSSVVQYLDDNAYGLDVFVSLVSLGLPELEDRLLLCGQRFIVMASEGILN